MLIQGIIFDFGGVIMRTEDKSPRSELAKRLGMTYEELAEIVFNSPSAQEAALGRISEEQHWEQISKRLDLSSQDLPEIQKQFWGGDRLDQELVSYIRSLNPLYKTELLSNAWSNLRPTLETLDIADAFNEIVISAEVGFAKPDRRIYEIAANRLSISPPEAVFIDDFEENLAGARTVGMRTIHFRNRAQALAELEQILEA